MKAADLISFSESRWLYRCWFSGDSRRRSSQTHPAELALYSLPERASSPFHAERAQFRELKFIESAIGITDSLNKSSSKTKGRIGWFGNEAE
jgi:hypothetical protein